MGKERQCSLQQQQRTTHIDVIQARELFGGGGSDGLVSSDAGVVDDDIDGGALCGGDDGGGAGEGAEVGADDGQMEVGVGAG